MSKQARTWLYIVAVGAVGVLLAALPAWLWPLGDSAPPVWLVPTLIALIAVTGRFPIEISRQAPASLFTVPLFMAALLIHPTVAVLVAAAGTLISEVMLKAPTRAISFNVGVSAVAGGLAATVFFALGPQTGGIALTWGEMLAAGAAGAVLHVTNLVLVSGMVTLRKGWSFWRPWDAAYSFEAIQEGGLLTLGLLAALLVSQVWWGLFLIMFPSVLAFYGFKRSLGEAVQKAKLAEELGVRLTELKELQAKLIQSAKLASVGTLAAGVAHEINNPVFAIAGRAELLLRNPDEYLSGEKSRGYVKTIFEMSQRISSIVALLLQHARPSEEAEVVKMSEVMEGALSLVSSKAASGRVRVLREFRDVPTVRGVPAQLQQVFVNLLSNSLDATGDSGVITIGCQTEDSIVRAYVRDDGVGIPKEAREHLFEPFFTTKPESTEGHRWTA